MKDQYVGDVNDYRKYALLRALAAHGEVRIGVCWMLTPDEADNNDGRKLAYLEKPEKHRRFDPELFDLLARAASERESGWRRLQTIEASGVLPRAVYFNDELPQKVAERQAYMETCLKGFAAVDLVFFDPDNGLDVPSAPIGTKKSTRYVFLDELKAFYAAGKSLLVYQHFNKAKKRNVLIADCVGRFRSIAPDASIWFFLTSHVVFFLLVHPQSQSSLKGAASKAAIGWDGKFIWGREASE